MKTFLTFALAGLCSLTASAAAVTSPGGLLSLTQSADSLEIFAKDATGVKTRVMAIAASKARQLRADGKVHRVAYRMAVGKRAECSNSYREASFATSARDGRTDTVTVRLFTDGFAWRNTAGTNAIDLSTARSARLQKWTDSYEGFFPLTQLPEGVNAEWGYPALFDFSDELHLLLSETALPAGGHGATLISREADRRGVFRNNHADGWQAAIVGSLADIVESTLITDAATPALYRADWVKPGMASWIYWAHNHGSKDPRIVRQYIDFAAEMGLPYVLIDAEWDEIAAPESIEGLLAYAVGKGVKPMIWYNSSIGWVNGAPGPKYRLNTPEGREREFAWCERNGIKGVKIDFFSGDTPQNFTLMDSLLRVAAAHGLAVNFHGATIPRGWQRTYPNLVTNEGVYGAEWYNNVPTFTPLAAAHNATLPFTRNVIASMDYTPCAFSDSQHPHITTRGHELALLTLFESGIQHLADRPESILAQPAEVQNVISTIPTAWDDTRLISGQPGHHAVIARRKGAAWYIAAINGTDTSITLPLSFSRLRLPKKAKVLTLTDNASATDWAITSGSTLPASITLPPRGGITWVVGK